jgi:putative ABC transport system permease protein
VTAVRRFVALAREAIATSWAQPVASIVTIVIVAGMCATVLLTTGRTVGAEQAVLGSIDSAGTRSIVVRADPSSGLTTGVLDRVANIEGIEWVGAFGHVTDVQNSAVPGGPNVPVRAAWGGQFAEIGVSENLAVPGHSAWASAEALSQLGMPDGVGGVVAASGADFGVVGSLVVPDYLLFLEPLIVVPQNARSEVPEPVAVLVVIAARPDLVSPLAAAISSVLAVDDPSTVTLTTSEGLAALRALIEGQLGSFGRNLVVVIFAMTAALVAVILYGLVMLRRKDFGRRRALGASQTLIVGLLLIQVATLAGIGALAGSGAAAIWLRATGDPLPGFGFFVSVGVLAVVVGVVAALLPAVAAARRDPLTELRVP